MNLDAREEREEAAISPGAMDWGHSTRIRQVPIWFHVHFNCWNLKNQNCLVSYLSVYAYRKPQFAPWWNRSDPSTIKNPFPCLAHSTIFTVQVFSKQSQSDIAQSCTEHCAGPFYMQSPTSISVLLIDYNDNASWASMNYCSIYFRKSSLLELI